MANTIIKGKRKLSNGERKMHEFPFTQEQESTREYVIHIGVEY